MPPVKKAIPALTWEQVKGRQLHYNAPDGHGGVYVARKRKQRYELTYTLKGGEVIVCKGTLTQCQDKAEEDYAKRYPPKAADKTASKSQQKKARKHPTPDPEPEPAPKPPARPVEVPLSMLPLGGVFHVPDINVMAGELLDRNDSESKVQVYRPGQGVDILRWSNGTQILVGGDRTLLNGQISARPAAVQTVTMRPVAVENVTKVPVTCTVGAKGGKRFSVFGIPATHVIRWMAYKGWTREQIETVVLQKMGLQIMSATFDAQIVSGKKGDEGSHGPIPKLTKDQEQSLKELL